MIEPDTQQMTNTVEPRLSDLRLTETPVRRFDFQDCLPQDTSEPLPISLLWKVDGADEWQIDVCVLLTVQF